MLFDVDAYKLEYPDSSVKREPVRKGMHKIDRCPLCGGAIKRFDAEVFLAAGRCAPCHEALEEA